MRFNPRRLWLNPVDCLFGLTASPNPEGSHPSNDNWRRERDSNPRYLAVHSISNAAQSTTLPSLLVIYRRFSEKGGGQFVNHGLFARFGPFL